MDNVVGPEDQLLRMLQLREGVTFQVVGFIDGKHEKGMLIHGIPVLGPPANLGDILATTQARYVVLTAPLANGPGLTEVARHCQEAGVELVSMTWSLRPMALSGDHQAGVSKLRSGALEPVQGHADLHARTLQVSPKGSPR